MIVEYGYQVNLTCFDYPLHHRMGCGIWNDGHWAHAWRKWE